MVMAPTATEKFSHKDKQMFSNMLVSSLLLSMKIF